MLYLLKHNLSGNVFVSIPCKYLITVLNIDKFYYLLNGNEYTIGRKDADILIAGDESISRRHAVIIVKVKLRINKSKISKSFYKLHSPIELSYEISNLNTEHLQMVKK